MRRILSCILCLCLAFCLCVPAAAAEPTGEMDDTYEALSLQDAQWTYDESADAWCLTNVAYCLNPAVPDVQYLNIYVPAAYLDESGNITEQVMNGYNAQTAPIILANDIGGYAQSTPTSASRCSEYLSRGYVVVCPGVRGRDTVNDDGEYVGTGCADIVDLKAAVRFIKYNDSFIPGDAECIVSVGRSAGGALSAVLACSGNNGAYDSYLEEIGAVMTATDDIYAAQCYCPITDCENQSMNYEWFYLESLGLAQSDASGEAEEMNEFQLALSGDLAEQFVTYLNSLALEDKNDSALTLEGVREGSYYDYVLSQLEQSLSDYVCETYSVTVSGMSAYTYLDEEAVQAYIDELNADGEWVSAAFTYATATTGPSTIVTYANGCDITMTSIGGFTNTCHARETLCPAYDDPDYSDPCCALFASLDGTPNHFDTTLAALLASGAYDGMDGFENVDVSAYADAADLADVAAFVNPVAMIEGSDVASFVRVRTGTCDMASSMVEGMNVALALSTRTDALVDYALAWNQPHGDAEINSEDLYDWIERVCKYENRHTEDEIASLLNLDNMEYSWTLSGSGDTTCYILSPIVEVANPELANYQGFSVAVPAYYVKSVNEDGSLEFDYDYEFENPNGVTYTAATAPIIINTGAAGYSAGTTSRAGSSYAAYGYINVACGNRGKSLSATDAEGNMYYCGDAPYCLVDQKSCVRWLKYNIALGNICGDAERMISTGGSGGGAHSLMLAATGNNPDFYPYLEESGAVMRYTDESGNVVEISDGIWGCCPYSAITNLEEANMAYEFESGLATDDSVVSRYSEFRQLLSQGEAEQYMEYINSKGLTYDIDGDGEREALTIEYDAQNDVWSGTFIQLMEQFMEEQLAWYLNHLDENELTYAMSYDGETYAEAYLKGDYVSSGSGEMSSGEASAETEEGYASAADESAVTGTGEDLTEWVSYTVDENGVYDVDFDIGDFINYRGRGKTNPAFDDLDLGQAENQEFGDDDQDFKHWDEYVLAAMDAHYDELDAAYDCTDAAAESFDDLYEAYAQDIASMLEGDKFGQNIVYLYNPANYILDEDTDLPAWVHIVHGTADTDSSTLISMVDAIEFDMAGVDSFVAWSWDDPHVAGDPIGTTMQGYIDSMVLAGY